MSLTVGAEFGDAILGLHEAGDTHGQDNQTSQCTHEVSAVGQGMGCRLPWISQLLRRFDLGDPRLPWDGRRLSEMQARHPRLIPREPSR